MEEAICIVEKSKNFLKLLFVGREVLLWFVRAMEECSNFRGNRAPYQTKREGNKVFLIQHYQNSFGRFINLIE